MVEWSSLHSMTYVALTVAHATDEDLDAREIVLLRAFMARHMVRMGLDPAGLDDLLLEVGEVYAGDRDLDGFAAAAQHVAHESVDRTELLGLYGELIELAEADDSVRAAEDEVLETLRRAWDLRDLAPAR